jgi:hypothetical protein
MFVNKPLTKTEYVNDSGKELLLVKENTKNNKLSGLWNRVKDSFKRNTVWWIIGISVAIAVIIGLIAWGIFALVKRGKSETFVPFDQQSNLDHNALNIAPETSYLETYISSALNVN